jgi:hypothetical protein
LLLVVGSVAWNFLRFDSFLCPKKENDDDDDDVGTDVVELRDGKSRENKKNKKNKGNDFIKLNKIRDDADYLEVLQARLNYGFDAMAREKKIDDQQPYLLRYASCLRCGCTKGTALRITIVGLLAAVMMALTVVVLCGVGIVVALLQ